jgi:transposase
LAGILWTIAVILVVLRVLGLVLRIAGSLVHLLLIGPPPVWWTLLDYGTLWSRERSSPPIASTATLPGAVSTPGVAREPPALEPSKRRGKTKPPYPAEFRRAAVRLMEQGSIPAAQMARELGGSPDPLRAWPKQRAIDTGQRVGLTTGERQELGQLRREARRLREEREILEEAGAFFAAESVTR